MPASFQFESPASTRPLGGPVGPTLDALSGPTLDALSGPTPDAPSGQMSDAQLGQKPELAWPIPAPTPTLAQKTDLRNFDLLDLQAFIKPLGKERFRATQLMKWLYQKDAQSFDDMTDLSKSFREELSRIATLSRMEPHTILNSDDGTRKFLYSLEDGFEIESVVIPEEDRLTLCISTQVGCPLACSFCVTGLGGVKRNLRVSEILGQILGVQRHLSDGQRLTNIVVMGMGEPLLNYDNVVKALKISLYEDGLNFSHRRITLSTAGVVPNIDRLAQDLPVNLAVSLNATTDAMRRELMPITRRYSLNELLDACRRYPLQHKKRITFEYVLLAGINDTHEDAARLFRLLKGIQAKVNLIPYNENAWSGYRAPDFETVKAFQHYLVSRHVLASVRWSRGPDIGAACGQLGASRVRVDKFRADPAAFDVDALDASTEDSSQPDIAFGSSTRTDSDTGIDTEHVLD